MADPHGFQKYAREERAHRPVPLRLLDYREVYEDAPEGQLQIQATRCMDCGVPFCHQGCPLGNIIPEWNDLVRQERWKEAFDRLHATNNFPEFTGRLCPAPCEGACVLGISQDPVSIKAVELEIVEHAWREGWVKPIKPSFDTGQQVAVVGSGPAGLAAAQQLTRAGHKVTVFERDDRLGGLMRYGVPEFKMEKKWIDRRLEQMAAEGTEFRTGVSPTAADLAGFDAVILATGTPIARDLDVPGRDLDGVHFAMEYLPLQNRVCEGDEEISAINAKDKNVIIIGGGDTGTDCFGTALRQGAKSVAQFDLYPQLPQTRGANNPWPTWPRIHRVATAHEEGEYVVTGNESADEIVALGLAHRAPGDTLGERAWSMSTDELVGENGRVTKLRGHKLTDGIGTPATPENSFELDADLVLLAMGFAGAERSGIIHELGVAFDGRGRITRDEDFRATIKPLFPNFKPRVYAVGDNARGQSLIVWAIAEGRSCAAAVDRDLMGETALPAPIETTDTQIQ
ncbi:MAG: glutamate synthase subunit beta [Corynebacterium sp.]|nr:glutamate synthase subunit beta [Corynebacterium sp.]